MTILPGPAKIRSHIAALALAALLPALLFSLLTVFHVLRLERQATERGVRESARAIALSLDREIASSISSLKVLASSENLSSGNYSAFYLEAKKAINNERAWIGLFDSTARQLVNTGFPMDAKLPDRLNPERVKNVVEAQQPSVSDLYLTPLAQRPILTVDVPVIRDGKVNYVLTKMLLPETLERAFKERPLPSDWIAAIFDRNGITLARTHRPEQFVFEPGRADIVAKVAEVEDGWFPNVTREGVAVYNGFTRSKLTGWSIVIGVPKSSLDAPARRAAWTLGLGAVGAATIAIFLAGLIGNQISAAMRSLSDAAQAVGTGVIPPAVSSPIVEADQVGQALHQSATLLDERLQALKLSEDELRKSEAQFRQLADALPQLVWTARSDGFIDYYNERWYEFTGFSRDRYGDDSWAPILHPEDLKRCQERYYDSIRTGKPYEIEYRFKDRRTNGYRWFLGRAYPVRNQQGKIVRWFGTCTDIDETKKTAEALKEADRRKDEFFAMLGHELRNPLGVISSFVQILRLKGPTDPELVELRDGVDRQVKHVIRLIDDLLEVSRITQGRLTLKKEPCDLAAIVRDTAKDCVRFMDSKRFAIKEILPGSHVWVMGDRTRLIQVLSNLLHNSCKFTDDGGTVTVELQTRPEDHVATLCIRDTGVGMQSDMLTRAFEPFTQADQGIHRGQGGLGLGLALVKGIVELHDGKVWALSEGPGRGSAFFVELPLCHAKVTPPQKPPPVEDESGDYRVLVIEDNRMGARMLDVLLTRKGYAVTVATSGTDGLRVAEQMRPDVVLCDIGLPDMDGYTVAENLRRNSSCKNVFLIAISGYGQTDNRERARQAGFDEYLIKPVELKDLEELMRNRFGNSA